MNCGWKMYDIVLVFSGKFSLGGSNRKPSLVYPSVSIRFSKHNNVTCIVTNGSNRVTVTPLSLNTIRFFEITIAIYLVVYTRVFRSRVTGASRSSWGLVLRAPCNHFLPSIRYDYYYCYYFTVCFKL